MHSPKIPARVLAELNRQFNDELSAAHGYLALSLWCEDQNLKGFASYFGKQSAEEQGHAKKLANHLIDRGVMPEIAAAAAPKGSSKSPLEFRHQARGMGSAKTKGINAPSKPPPPAKDIP